MLAQPTTAPGLLQHAIISPPAPNTSFALRDLPLALLLRLVPQATLRKVHQSLPQLVSSSAAAKTPLFAEAEVSSSASDTTATESSATTLETVYSSSEGSPGPVATPKRTRSAVPGDFVMSPFIPDAESTPAYVAVKDVVDTPQASHKLLRLADKTTLNPRAVSFTPSVSVIGRTSTASPADSDEPFMSARNPSSTYCRLASPIADRLWWESVTKESTRQLERDSRAPSLGAAANILM